MARDLGVGFSLVWAKTEKYRDAVFGSVIINIKEEDMAAVSQYFQNFDVKVEVLGNGQ
jgi:D-methionine transport system ATP-binding protein